MITLPIWAFIIICIFAGFSAVAIIYLLIDFVIYCVDERKNEKNAK